MNIDTRFASKAENVDETPEPFRRHLRKHLKPNEQASFLVYAPAYTSVEKFPATVLAVTDQRWLIFEGEEDESVSVSEAAFDDTLLVELTEILLFGRLKIDFASGGEAQSSAVQFNTSMDKLYREAVQLVLNGIERPLPLTHDADSGQTTLSLPEWPLKFRNYILESVSQGRRVLFATHWPAVSAGFRRELAPAAAFVITESEIILVADPPAGHLFEPREDNKYGRIVTYFPLVRLAQHRISRHEQFSLLELEAHASHGGEKLQIMFPSSHESEVSELIDRALAAAG